MFHKIGLTFFIASFLVLGSSLEASYEAPLKPQKQSHQKTKPIYAYIELKANKQQLTVTSCKKTPIGMKCKSLGQEHNVDSIKAYLLSKKYVNFLINVTLTLDLLVTIVDLKKILLSGVLLGSKVTSKLAPKLSKKIAPRLSRSQRSILGFRVSEVQSKFFVFVKNAKGQIIRKPVILSALHGGAIVATYIAITYGDLSFIKLFLKKMSSKKVHISKPTSKNKSMKFYFTDSESFLNSQKDISYVLNQVTKDIEMREDYYSP